MALDTTSLANAVRRLREGLVRHQTEPGDEQLRDGLIQRFEFTYELSHRTLRRYLVEVAASPDAVAAMPFADLIRVGNAQGLLRGDWPVWRRFREMRSRTSHTYDAGDRCRRERSGGGPAGAFLAEAEYLLAELQGQKVGRTGGSRSLIADICRTAGSRSTLSARPDGRAAILRPRPGDRCRTAAFFDETAGLGEAFSESDLPYRVDLVDWQAIDESFRRLIAADRLPLVDASVVCRIGGAL